MAAARLDSVLRHLRRALLLPDAGLTDQQLLELFLARRDEAAFAGLVRRHGPMVLGVCRRVLKNNHDAEDAFQATFLVLVRKADSLRGQTTLGNWLYGVACRTAWKARAANWKRQEMEKLVTEMPAPATPAEEAWPELRPLLDHELSRLPGKYREAIVLCDLEGKSRSEAARHLEVPEGTVSGRLTKARRLLAERLTRRGVTLSAVALAAALSQEAASAGVPRPLVVSTARAATLAATGSAASGGVAGQAGGLTKRGLRAMLIANWKRGAVILLAVAVLGAGASLFLGPALTEGRSHDTPTPAAAPAPPDDQLHAAPRPVPNLPEGIIQVALPEGVVAFEPVHIDDAWLVRVRVGGATFTAPRVFFRDRDQVIEYSYTAKNTEENGEEKPSLTLTSPPGASFYGVPSRIEQGTFIVGSAPEGGRDRIRAGDVVLTHPNIYIKVGNETDYLSYTPRVKKPK